MINIKFFGNDILTTDTDTSQFRKLTFVDVVCNHYNINLSDTISELYSGVLNCSEERILFYLKKQKELDLAVIFHGDPVSVFFPSLSVDLKNAAINTVLSDDIEKNKIKVNYIDSFRYLKSFNNVYKNSISFDVLEKICKNYDQFFHPDIELNRFYSSLMQIDQYLIKKEINAIHIPYPDSIPSWFKFNSGIVDIELSKFQNGIFHNNKCSNWPNKIDEITNKTIASTLILYIDNMLKSL